MPLTFIQSPDKEPPDKDLLDGEVLDAAVNLLRIQVDGPAKNAARQEIRKIARNFARDHEQAKTTHKADVAEGRNALKDLPDDAAVLAGRFRQASIYLARGYGAATFSFADTDEVEQTKREEAETLAIAIRRGADMLDEIAAQLRPGVDLWATQKTGELNIDGMAYGYAVKKLVGSGGQLFVQHRPADFRAGKKGDFLPFLEYLYELGAGHEPPSDDMMLRHARDAVIGIKAAQTDQ